MTDQNTSSPGIVTNRRRVLAGIGSTVGISQVGTVDADPPSEANLQEVYIRITNEGEFKFGFSFESVQGDNVLRALESGLRAPEVSPAPNQARRISSLGGATTVRFVDEGCDLGWVNKYVVDGDAESPFDSQQRDEAFRKLQCKTQQRDPTNNKVVDASLGNEFVVTTNLGYDIESDQLADPLKFELPRIELSGFDPNVVRVQFPDGFVGSSQFPLLPFPAGEYDSPLSRRREGSDNSRFVIEYDNAADVGRNLDSPFKFEHPLVGVANTDDDVILPNMVYQYHPANSLLQGGARRRANLFSTLYAAYLKEDSDFAERVYDESLEAIDNAIGAFAPTSWEDVLIDAVIAGGAIALGAILTGPVIASATLAAASTTADLVSFVDGTLNLNDEFGEDSSARIRDVQNFKNDVVQETATEFLQNGNERATAHGITLGGLAALADFYSKVALPATVMDSLDTEGIRSPVNLTSLFKIQKEPLVTWATTEENQYRWINNQPTGFEVFADTPDLYRYALSVQKTVRSQYDSYGRSDTRGYIVAEETELSELVTSLKSEDTRATPTILVDTASACSITGGTNPDCTQEDLSLVDTDTQFAVRKESESGVVGDWIPITPIQSSDKNHKELYTGGSDTTYANGHGNTSLPAAPETATIVISESTASDARYALILLYDMPDETGGKATLTISEAIDIENDVLLYDGARQGTGSSEEDRYETTDSATVFVHNWTDGFTDGAVIDATAFEETEQPQFNLIDLTDIEAFRVVGQQNIVQANPSEEKLRINLKPIE